MNNLEYYRDEIKKYNYDFALMDGILCMCLHISCELCEFESPDSRCANKKIEWLSKEHPMFSEKEISFLEIVNPEAYIAREALGLLVLHQSKPKKDIANMRWLSQVRNTVITPQNFPYVKLGFIKWDDEEPWQVKTLLDIAKNKEKNNGINV